MISLQLPLQQPPDVRARARDTRELFCIRRIQETKPEPPFSAKVAKRPLPGDFRGGCVTGHAGAKGSRATACAWVPFSGQRRAVTEQRQPQVSWRGGGGGGGFSASWRGTSGEACDTGARGQRVLRWH